VTVTDKQDQPDANNLCKACGLCCTGHLFTWAKLRASELESAAALGLKVLGSDPKNRGFSQPCPLWDEDCTIYTSPQYPHFCGLYKCKLLKNVMDETTPLPDALIVVEQTKELIQELEGVLPVSSNRNFRERFVAHFEQEGNTNFQHKAHILLSIYRDRFGVKDLVDHFDESGSF
jgi:hypothetical protein